MQNIKSRSFYCRRSSKTDVLARIFAEFHLSSSTSLPVRRWPTSVTSNRTGAWTSWTVFSPPSRTLKGEFYANDLGPLFLKEVFSIEILYLSFWIRTSPYFPSTVIQFICVSWNLFWISFPPVSGLCTPRLMTRSLDNWPNAPTPKSTPTPLGGSGTSRAGRTAGTALQWPKKVER